MSLYSHSNLSPSHLPLHSVHTTLRLSPSRYSTCQPCRVLLHRISSPSSIHSVSAPLTMPKAFLITNRRHDPLYSSLDSSHVVSVKMEPKGYEPTCQRISVLTHTALSGHPHQIDSNHLIHDIRAFHPNLLHLTDSSDHSVRMANIKLEAITECMQAEENVLQTQPWDETQQEAQDLSIHNRKSSLSSTPPRYSTSPSSSLSSDQFEKKYQPFLDSGENSTCSEGSFKLAEKGFPETSEVHTSSNGERHVCTDCGRHYSTSSNLARHKQTHRSFTDKRTRRCPDCNKFYSSLPAYNQHIKTHKRNCYCSYCGKPFSRPWLLQGHIRTHTGEKPFGCPQCPKAFADKSNLRAHIQTHSTIKPHICQRCGKAFALKSYLCKHEDSSCMKMNRKSRNGSVAYVSPSSNPETYNYALET